MADEPLPFSGVLVPVLTPFTAELAPDATRFTALCRWLLEEGVGGLAVFGTTSEGNSLSVGERISLLDHLVEEGLPGGRLMPGTGACALPDAVEMTRHAVDLGAGGVLVLPPFYYKNQGDDGFFAYFAEIIERVGDPRLRLYLYHFPQMSAAPISPALIARLVKAYPSTVAGLKDSSGDWEATKRLIAEFPDLAIFPSSESRLIEGLTIGAAGCISATANIQPGAIASLVAAHGSEAARIWHARICAVRAIFERYPTIPALKAVMARECADEAWGHMRPPLTALDAARRQALFSALDASGQLAPIRLQQTP
jgi:4-hydroxy-tetrahydrodipicolinate synthase